MLWNGGDVVEWWCGVVMLWSDVVEWCCGVVMWSGDVH